MPIESQHREYAAALPQWRRCRDAVAGTDAVQRAGMRYLPMLSGQPPAEYLAYALRTPWFGASGRTLEGMLGMVFQVDPVVTGSPSFLLTLKDATLTGVSAEGLSRFLLSEVLEVGRVGALVEFPTVAEGETLTQAEASAQNLRPYVTTYLAESIIDWRLERVNNAMQPVWIKLAEAYTEGGEDFQDTPVDKVQHRVLILDRETGYRQEVWRDGRLAETFRPRLNGQALKAIPFYPFGPQELSMRVQKSPLLDLVDLNFSHYRTSADLEHGAHFTGLPTPFLAGVRLGENETVKIGSATAIVSENPEAKASYLEFSGQGLGALERLLDRKQAQMAALGARMLAPDKAGVEAEGTLQMRSNGENSALGGIVKLTAQGMEEMLAFAAKWNGDSKAPTFALNTDYLPRGIDAQKLTALVSTWQQGGISFQTLQQNLQRAEIVDPDVTPEQEQARIGDHGPAPLPSPAPPPVAA